MRLYMKMKAVGVGCPSLSLEAAREREREFYLTPVGPGCGHMAAAAAEKRL